MMHQYKIEVTRTEVREVSERELAIERLFQLGKKHRKEGRPAMSASGTYLNGYYNPDVDFYYIDKEAAHLL